MLEARDIAFAYGRKRILDGATLSVASGETVALVGANGSGKTTFLRVLAGLLPPHAGTVLADGADTRRDSLRFRRALGYLPERTALEDDLRVADYLKFRARVKGEQARKIRHRVAEALAACDLTDLAAMRLDRLSFGQRRRVALADALVLRPRFLLADDPFAGVDPAARAALARAFAACSPFCSVVVTGHDLETLGAFATRFVHLHAGRLEPLAEGVKGARAALLS